MSTPAGLVAVFDPDLQELAIRLGEGLEIPLHVIPAADAAEHLTNILEAHEPIGWLITDSMTILRYGLEIPAHEGAPPSLWFFAREKFEARAALRIGAAAVIPLESRFVNGEQE